MRAPRSPASPIPCPPRLAVRDAPATGLSSPLKGRGAGGTEPAPAAPPPPAPSSSSPGPALPARRAKGAQRPGSETAQSWGQERGLGSAEPTGPESWEKGQDARKSPTEALGKLKPCRNSFLVVALQPLTEEPLVQIS